MPEAVLTTGLTCITKYQQPYAHATYSADVKQFAVGASDYAYALLGARYGYGNSGNFKVAAIGDYDSVFASTSSSSTAYLNRGTYWYHYPGTGSAGSMGFAPDAAVSLSPADTASPGDNTRMSWNLDQSSNGLCGFHRQFSPLQGRAVLQRGVILLGASHTSARDRLPLQTALSVELFVRRIVDIFGQEFKTSFPACDMVVFLRVWMTDFFHASVVCLFVINTLRSCVCLDAS